MCLWVFYRKPWSVVLAVVAAMLWLVFGVLGAGINA
jgi:hypothetical protein